MYVDIVISNVFYLNKHFLFFIFFFFLKIYIFYPKICQGFHNQTIWLTPGRQNLSFVVEFSVEFAVPGTFSSSVPVFRPVVSLEPVLWCPWNPSSGVPGACPLVSLEPVLWCPWSPSSGAPAARPVVSLEPVFWCFWSPSPGVPGTRPLVSLQPVLWWTNCSFCSPSSGELITLAAARPLVNWLLLLQPILWWTDYSCCRPSSGELITLAAARARYSAPMR